MPNKLIEISDIHKQFETDEVITKVLHGITIEIQMGEFIAIMGPSGSGKSTLMHILSFLDRPSSGEFIFEGENITGFDDNKLAELRNKKLGFVFQSFNLLPRTSVLENVILPLQYSKDHSDKVGAATRALKSVGLEHRLDHLSNQLSGGEKQRVAIARALVNDPDVIFADEPTGNLDSKSGQQVMEIIDALNKKNKTIIMVTHEQYTANTAKRIIKLKDGLVVSDLKVKKRVDVHNGLIK
jgi:putative ABC transport system ATP-binding protein